MNNLEHEIQQLKERNLRVDADKAWETSWTRRLLVLILTYSVMVVFFYYANLERPLLNAIVPALAFVLSTTSIPLVKNLWLKRHRK